MRTIYICICWVLSMSAYGQTDYNIQDTQLIKLASTMSSLYPEDEARKAASDSFNLLFVEWLRDTSSVDYDFSGLKDYISILEAPDADLRVFTWYLMHDEDHYEYFGVLQKLSDPQNPIVLDDVSDELPMTDMIELTRADWYGAYYYNILPHTAENGDQVYILFGYDANDRFSNKKIIETLFIDKDNQVNFGYPLFFHDDGPRYRRVFDADATSATRVNFDADLDMIIYNNLIAAGGDSSGKDELGGMTMKVYSRNANGDIVLQDIAEEAEKPTTDRMLMRPDGSYQGYKLENGRWTFVDKVFHQILDEAPRPKPILGKVKED